MELHHLRQFVAVADHGHLGRAAAQLEIAQPRLSQQIRQLEEELGVELLERATRRVELTPAGYRYLRRARSILEAVDDAGAEAALTAAGKLGRVRVGFVGSATYDLLPALARALRLDLPDLELELRGEISTARQAAELRVGTLDVGFLVLSSVYPELETEVLRRESLVVALPSEHRLAHRRRVRFAELANDSFVLPPRNDGSGAARLVLDACYEAGFQPRTVHEVAETSTALAFVAAGLGVAVLPASASCLGLADVVHLPVYGTTARLDLAVAVRRDDDRPELRHVVAWARRLAGRV